jgi:hypothetical protein
MQVFEQTTAGEASSKQAKSRDPYVTVRQGEDIIQAIVRHRRETGYVGGVLVTFDKSSVA